MWHFSLDRVPFSLGPPPATELSRPNHFQQTCGFVVAYFFLLTLISFLLPRPWFVALLKIGFPFVPESLKDSEEKNHD